MGSFTFLSVLLLIIGFILIGIEFMMPGFSLPGILGVTCLVLCVLITAKSFIDVILLVMGILAIVGIMLGIMIWFFSKGKIVSPLILKDEQNKEKGYISSNDLEYLLGKEGITITDLRPTGIGEFNGVRLDVVSEGDYVQKGSEIIIFKVEGSKLVVKGKSNYK
ncbi:serine protease [Clostridium tarantellae]|uniref:Serine protease n=1 Tax=Clostridium tarantellae TaxID=39493 RepID=A0A6I1MTF0_9CLOT|nr:serine protease [Clostridium tarantellae]